MGKLGINIYKDIYIFSFFKSVWLFIYLLVEQIGIIDLIKDAFQGRPGLFHCWSSSGNTWQGPCRSCSL
jgi:hypothetical protein